MSEDTTLHLPGILGELARRGHGGAALRLADDWGGGLHYVPKVPAVGSPIVTLIGMEAALVMAELRGGENVDFPRAAARHSLKQSIHSAEGGTRAIAQALGCTERWVREVRNAGTKADERQISLFD